MLAFLPLPTRLLALIVALLVALVVVPAPSAAHEVPARVAVHVIARADSQWLRLVVRVPLESVRDLEIPTVRGDYLDIARLSPLLHDAATLWIAGYLELYEGSRRLDAPRVEATRIALPSDRSFERFDLAVSNAHAPPLDNTVELPWRQAMLDVVLAYPIASPASRFSVRPLLAHLGVETTTVLRWVGRDGGERAYRYDGNPGLVRLDPGIWQAAAQFVALGFEHILGGLDHLLFLLCLVIPVRRVLALVGVITAFTAAHSLTLIASALGMAPSAGWFPPLVEFLIAASIVLLALENIVGARLERRWILAFVFGLVHGFGFSFALRDSLQFAGGHLLASLLAFNVGVELGQLLVLLMALPLVTLLLRRVVAERAGVIVLSAVVAHEAWHWMTERLSVVRAYSFMWPALDLALAATILRTLMFVLLTVAVLWGVATLVARLSRVSARLAGAAPHTAPPDPGGAPVSRTRWTFVLAACMIVGAAPTLRAQDAGGLRSTLKGVFTDAQAARGKDIYVGACRECHSPQSHVGVVFKNSWGGKRLSDLLAYMQERMPKNNPGSLTNEEYAAVTAYILMLNGLPSGDDELPSDPEAARRIRIETTGK
jgi:mono/diheme cytochrome c family protein